MTTDAGRGAHLLPARPARRADRRRLLRRGADPPGPARPDRRRRLRARGGRGRARRRAAGGLAGAGARRGARRRGAARAGAGADERAPRSRRSSRRWPPSRLDLAANRATVRLAGHPPPLLLAGGRVAPVPAPGGRLLGRTTAAEPIAYDLGFDTDDWSLLMYTDGLIEGRVGDGDERLDVAGLQRAARRAGRPRGAAARAAGLAGRPGRAAQRRPARRRRGHAAGHAGAVAGEAASVGGWTSAPPGRSPCSPSCGVLLIGLAGAERGDGRAQPRPASTPC